MDTLLPIDLKPLELAPRFVTIEAWTVVSSMSRTSVVDHIAKGHLVAHMLGARVLIDLEASTDWIKSQPAPNLKFRPRGPQGRPGWGTDEIARLIELRATPGLSEAEIGARMGRTKSSVHAKIVRLREVARFRLKQEAHALPPSNTAASASNTHGGTAAPDSHRRHVTD